MEEVVAGDRMLPIIVVPVLEGMVVVVVMMT